jgi:hypothetical protein
MNREITKGLSPELRPGTPALIRPTLRRIELHVGGKLRSQPQACQTGLTSIVPNLAAACFVAISITSSRIGALYDAILADLLFGFGERIVMHQQLFIARAHRLCLGCRSQPTQPLSERDCPPHIRRRGSRRNHLRQEGVRRGGAGSYRAGLHPTSETSKDPEVHQLAGIPSHIFHAPCQE